TPADVAFVATTARGPAQKFGLMILLKVYQRLGYFPKPETIPGAIIGHLRAVMKLEASLVPDIASNHTLYRYHAAIREHLEIRSEGKHIRGRLRIRVKSYHKAICYNARRSGEACAFGQGQRGAYRLDINQFVTNEQAENRISAEDYAGTLLDEMEQPRFICQRFTAAY
ncbi:MAG: DUF4158 domain-containing protein, partial [Chloroflexi bacterium]